MMGIDALLVAGIGAAALVIIGVIILLLID